MTPAAEAEVVVGISCYATGGGPCGGRARSFPSDFVVEEEISLEGLTPTEKPGYFPLYRVEKRSVDTLHMARELSEALKSRVTFGGMKDKRAEAVQYVTPSSLRSERPELVVKERFTATLLGYLPRPLGRGSVVGNRFEIVLRECCSEVEARIREAMESATERRLPNFYGLQRFGVLGAGTHMIGRAIVNRDFEGAVEVMLRADGASPADYSELVRTLPPGKDVERMVAKELGRHPGDWVRALRAVPVRLRRLYVQAYQSFIFNRTLSLALERGEDISEMRTGDNWAGVSEDGLTTGRVMGVRDRPSGGAVPMVQVVGYAYRDYRSRFDAYLREVLEDEEVQPGRFFVEEMQEVSSEGGFRRPHLAVRDPSWRSEGSVARLSFTLATGQYATVLLREVMKPSDPSSVGLA